MSNEHGHDRDGGFCPEHSGIVNEKDNLKTEIARLQRVIERLECRLPLWATAAFTAVGFVIGTMATWIFHLESLSKIH